jgi:hypothetical protein
MPIKVLKYANIDCEIKKEMTKMSKAGIELLSCIS